jgi:hypothetical protein
MIFALIGSLGFRLAMLDFGRAGSPCPDSLALR